MIARRLTLIAVLPLVLACCGGSSDEPERVCHMVRPATVAKELRGSGAEVQGSLRPHADETPGLSVCSYRGGGVNARVSRDTAPQAPLR